MTLLLPCDVVLFRNQTLLNKAIGFFTRSWGEEPTIAKHCGLVVAGGWDLEATIIESNAVTRRRTLREGYGSNDTEICVFRPLNLTDDQKSRILAKAETYVGCRYGYLKLGLHAADWCLNDAYVFRRLGRIDRRPVCSFSLAGSYEAGGLDYGVPKFQASPDDIWDFCVRTLGNKYQFTWQRGTMFQLA